MAARAGESASGLLSSDDDHESGVFGAKLLGASLCPMVRRGGGVWPGPPTVIGSPVRGLKTLRFLKAWLQSGVPGPELGEPVSKASACSTVKWPSDGVLSIMSEGVVSSKRCPGAAMISISLISRNCHSTGLILSLTKSSICRSTLAG